MRIIIRHKINLQWLGKDKWFSEHREGDDLDKAVECYKKTCLRAYRFALEGCRNDPLYSQKLRALISIDTGHFVIRDHSDVLVFFDIESA